MSVGTEPGRKVPELRILLLLLIRAADADADAGANMPRRGGGGDEAGHRGRGGDERSGPTKKRGRRGRRGGGGEAFLPSDRIARPAAVDDMGVCVCVSILGPDGQIYYILRTH